MRKLFYDVSHTLQSIIFLLINAVTFIPFLLVPPRLNAPAKEAFMLYSEPAAIVYWAYLFGLGLLALLLIAVPVGKYRTVIITSLFSLPLLALIKGSGLDTWTIWILLGLTVSGLVLGIAASRLGAFHSQPSRQLVGGALNQTNNFSRQYKAVRPRYTFQHVIGMEPLKQRLLKAGLDITKDVSAQNGILLYGEPGNGKTYFAEALAGQLKLPFLMVSFGDIASKWVGETTQQAMTVFDDAEAQAPCLLFIDEIDSVFVDRGAITNADSEAPKTLNAILTRIVNLRGKGVVLVGATNFLTKLDTAAIREGRFDYKIEVPPPDYLARVGILSKQLESGLRKHGNKHSSLDIRGLELAAERWEGFSIARLTAVAAEVFKHPIENGKDIIDYPVIASALRRIQGSHGDRLSESVPHINDLVFEATMKARLISIGNRMMNVDRIEQMGGTVPNGLLFYGPPGTGKTLAAQALAKTSGWAFLKTSGQELSVDPDVIDSIYNRARDLRPAIVFIDEADDVLSDRRSSPMTKSATNRLISVMDGAGGRIKDIVFIAATNAPNILDEAALRGGRFSEKVAFRLPDIDAIQEYIGKWITSTKARLDPTFTPDAVSQLLVGNSLADIKEILQAAINASIARMSGHDIEAVTIKDLKTGLIVIKGNRDANF